MLSDIAQVKVLYGGDQFTAFTTSSFFVNTGTVYLALSFGTTLVITMLITYRILSVHRTNKSIFSDSDEKTRSSSVAISPATGRGSGILGFSLYS